jgi:exopolysaccharide biosynthesis polyprenyl glycosylphosphotransferase
MLRRFSTDFAILMITIDALLISASLQLAEFVRPNLSQVFPYVKQFDGPIQTEPGLYFIFPLIWVTVLFLFSVYDARKNLKVVNELYDLTLSSIISLVSMAGLLYLSYRDMSRALFGVFFLFGYVSLVTVRIIYRIIFRIGLVGIQQRRILIIGAGVVGKEVENNINQFKGIGYTLVGFLDDDVDKSNQPLVLGTLDDIRTVIRRDHIDDIVFALPLWAYHRCNQITQDLHDVPVKIWIVPDYFSMTLSHAQIADLVGLPMIDLRAPTLNEYQRMVKRVFDLFISIFILPVALPIMGFSALAIRLNSPGPIFFKQTRVGENGRLFEMIKFRTMKKDAEQNHHLIEKIDKDGRIQQDKSIKDPRITRVGRFLRKTSIDELPQLFNVLRGEMSLVGPRPEMPYLVDQYEPWQRRRFSIPQGITGWWQINGRSDKPMHLHTEDDLYYIQNYSLWLDIMILVRTIWTVFKHNGAY